jgi:hypothetical protein
MSLNRQGARTTDVLAHAIVNPTHQRGPNFDQDLVEFRWHGDATQCRPRCGPVEKTNYRLPDHDDFLCYPIVSREKLDDSGHRSLGMTRRDADGLSRHRHPSRNHADTPGLERSLRQLPPGRRSLRHDDGHVGGDPLVTQADVGHDSCRRWELRQLAETPRADLNHAMGGPTGT